MAVFKTTIFNDELRGASMLEVLLAMAIVAVAAPFVYNQISATNAEIRNMADAKRIMDLRDPVLNFVRVNQDKWPEFAQIKFSDDELSAISELPTAGFIDKYSVRGATVSDVYLAFNMGDQLRANHIARHIGADAAVVDTDGVAYGNMWAVTAPDFNPGDIIYRITRDIAGEDKTKYLHRGTSGDDNLNLMLRDLHMGSYNILDVGSIIAESAKVKNATSRFVTTDDIMAQNVYFSDGATMDGGKVALGDIRVSGDVTGFRTISANNLNGANFTTDGRVIADRASVKKSVNVARDLVLKSSTTRTISGFTAISVNSVKTAYLSADEIIFLDNFGLTVSGELLVSTTAPLKIGNWSFPSTTAPRFSELSLSRGAMPDAPNAREFGPLMMSGWQSVQSVEARQ